MQHPLTTHLKSYIVEFKKLLGKFAHHTVATYKHNDKFQKQATAKAAWATFTINTWLNC